MNKSKPGQILVLVLLVVVVSLAIGLAVASRNLTNLQISTQAEQSQRAFTAAEGGVENTLSNLNNVAKYIKDGGTPPADCTSAGFVQGSQATCNLPSSVTSSGVSNTNSSVVIKANKSYEKTVQMGDVAQINLRSFPAGGTFDVEWGASSETAYKPSLEFTFICTNDGNTNCGVKIGTETTSTTKAANAYGQHRLAYQAEAILGQSGFRESCTPSTSFSCKVTLEVPAGAYSGFELLRMKPFWNRVTIKVTPQAQFASFPVQTYEITSTATTDTGLSRKVQVTRDALPQLPAIFDYVLYSGKDIIK